MILSRIPRSDSQEIVFPALPKLRRRSGTKDLFLSCALFFQERKKYTTVQYSTVQFYCAMAMKSGQAAPSNEHLAFGIKGERQSSSSTTTNTAIVVVCSNIPVVVVRSLGHVCS